MCQGSLGPLVRGSQAMAAQTNFKRGQKSQLANQVAHSGVSTTTASPGREKHIIRSIRKCFYHIPFFWFILINSQYVNITRWLYDVSLCHCITHTLHRSLPDQICSIFWNGGWNASTVFDLIISLSLCTQDPRCSTYMSATYTVAVNMGVCCVKALHRVRDMATGH